MPGQKRADDPLNPIRHADLFYRCITCGKTFEYIHQATSHREDTGEDWEHDFNVVDRND